MESPNHVGLIMLMDNWEVGQCYVAIILFWRRGVIDISRGWLEELIGSGV
jgi:hypothetical protein